MKQIFKKLKNNIILKRFFIITIGCFIYSLGIALFLDPGRIIPGGVSGIGIAVSHLTDKISTGTVMLIINIPLLLLGLWKFGKSFLFSTVYATIISSIFINGIEKLVADFLPLTDEMILISLAGGALAGLGVGLVFRGGGTTGGTDIIAKFIRVKHPRFKTNTIFLASDSIIVAGAAIVFKDVELALFSAITLILFSKCLDLVLYGPDGAKLVYIISDRPDEIAERLLNDLEVGVTYLKGIGAYSGKDKKVLMCASRKHIFPRIREVVTEVDDLAFMIVGSAQEIFGEGFKNHNESDL